MKDYYWKIHFKGCFCFWWKCIGKFQSIACLPTRFLLKSRLRAVLWTIKWSRRRSRGRRRRARSMMGTWGTASASCQRSAHGTDAYTADSGCCRLKNIESQFRNPVRESSCGWIMADGSSTYQPRSRSYKCRTRWGSSSSWSCRLWTGGLAGAGSARFASRFWFVRLPSVAARCGDSRPARGNILAAADYSPKKIEFSRIRF